MKKYYLFATKYPELIAFLVSVICSFIAIFIGIEGFWAGYINAATFYITYLLLKTEK